MASVLGKDARIDAICRSAALRDRGGGTREPFLTYRQELFAFDTAQHSLPYLYVCSFLPRQLQSESHRPSVSRKPLKSLQCSLLYKAGNCGCLRGDISRNADHCAWYNGQTVKNCGATQTTGEGGKEIK